MNAHSSRSHAILCVKLTQTSETRTLISRASAIDLAGSEDNRRTDNNRERLVESSAINKSLFVLAQCVEAISKGQARIPYRESKMTRILSLGQNNGLTVMILNLAPSRNFHLDTLSSLNFANRTKKIEVNEVENEPIFRGQNNTSKSTTSVMGPNIQRQPLRAISVASHNAHIGTSEKPSKLDKPIKAFSVYADKRWSQECKAPSAAAIRNLTSTKRALDGAPLLRPTKTLRPSDSSHRAYRPTPQQMSQEQIDDLISRRIDEKLAEKALEAQGQPVTALSEDLQKRLDALEQRVSDKDDGTHSEGLQFLLMAKQHAARGEDASALRMYLLAQPYFQGNSKLEAKIEALKDKLRAKKETLPASHDPAENFPKKRTRKPTCEDTNDSDYHEKSSVGPESEDEGDYQPRPKASSKPKTTLRRPALPSFTLIPPRSDPFVSSSTTEPKSTSSMLSDPVGPPASSSAHTPRTSHLLSIINTRDVARIKSLKGVGAKRAEAIVSALVDLNAEDITDLAQLGALRGVGVKTVENMRCGVGMV